MSPSCSSDKPLTGGARDPEYDGSGMGGGEGGRGEPGFDGSVGATVDSGSDSCTETGEALLASDARVDASVAVADSGSGTYAGAYPSCEPCPSESAGSGTGNASGVAPTSGVSSSVGIGLYASDTRSCPPGDSGPLALRRSPPALGAVTIECHGE